MTSRYHPRLSGLARNPAAPDEILIRLAAHPDGRHGIQQRPGRLADEVATALLTHGGADEADYLHGERVSPAMRHRIATHPDPAVRHAHADSVRSTVRCQAFVDIASIEEAYDAPRAVLVGAADPQVRAAVARAWYDRPQDVQERLLADPDPVVRAAATRATRPGVPAHWTDWCLVDPATRTKVARYVPLTPGQFAALMRTGDEEVHRSVAHNPHLSADMVGHLLTVDDPYVRVAVARSRHVDAQTGQRLYALVEKQWADGDLDAEVALVFDLGEPGWLRGAPLEDALTYLDGAHPVFRRVLASRGDLPEEVWQRLDDDPDLIVRRTAARRPQAPPAVLERLVRAHGEDLHLRPPLVEHPHFPRHALRTFADEPDPYVRLVALQDPALPEDILSRLAADAEPFVRGAAARHPGVTAAILERLLYDPDPEVADDAAASPVLERAAMLRILADAHL
jgi:hypothetical protein